MNRPLIALTALALGVCTAMAAPPRSALPVTGPKTLNAAGHAATARPMPLRIGEAPENTVEIPFTHDLGKAGTEVKNYTFINVNDDNRKWQYGTVSGYAACMPPNTDGIDANDDWLFTVPIHFTAGDYTVSFEVGMMGTGAIAVEMESKLGTAPTVEAMTQTISPATRYTEKTMTPYEYNLTVAEEGYYYIGLHCITAKDDKGTLKLANLGVKAGGFTPPVPVDPPAAGTLTWQLAPKGELKATVTYTAPTLTKGGEPLAEISKVELTSRWGVDKYTFTDVTPGQVIVQDVEMYAGINNRFTGVAYTGDTPGETVEHKSIFCGPDTPLPPTDVTLTVAPGFKSATLSWTAPGEVGERGGYVDTDRLTYYVFDAFGNYYDPALYTTADTQVTIDYSSLEGQDFMAYQVTAGVDDLYSLDTSSDIITVGTPGAMPFTESFADGQYDGLWLISQASTGSGTQMWGTVDDDYFASLIDPDDPDAPAPLRSQDADNGFYYWLPVEKDAVFGLVSTRTSLEGATEPVLEFWYQGQGSILDVYTAYGTAPFAKAASIDLQQTPAAGWTKASVPLDASQDAVQFELRLTAAHNDDDHTWSVPLDNIRIRENVPYELAVGTLSAPKSVTPASPLAVTAKVQNIGSMQATGASATLYVDDTAVETRQLPDMEPGMTLPVTFTYTVPVNAPGELQVQVSAELEGDPIAADNTASATVQVSRRAFATVTDLQATVEDHEVTLTWSEPVNDISTPEQVVEDFEDPSYTPMAIDGPGAWTVLDGDGVKTYNIFRELYNPYQTAPIGFQLFNRVAAQVPDLYWEDAAPASGDAFMMAPSAQDAQNDNWLISPPLSGRAQTVSFKAKSLMSAWPETMRVLYSVTGNSEADFTAEAAVGGLPDSRELPEVWTEYTVDLPEGATHFAIVHDSYDSLALLVDDVCYEGAPALPADLAVTGYHVLRDGVVILDEPVDALTHVDMPVPQGADDGEYSYVYSVVPEYNHGFAAESNRAAASVLHSGVACIEAARAGEWTLFTPAGLRVKNPAPGIYLGVRDGKACKVTVR